MYRKAKVKLLKLLGFFLVRRLLFIKVKKGERKKKIRGWRQTWQGARDSGQAEREHGPRERPKK